MPFPFKLSTTSSFSFSSCIESNSHPSLPLSASTYRGVLKDTLKKHKRLPPHSQTTSMSSVLLSAESYLPYLFAVDGGLSGQSIAEKEIDVVLKSTPILEWRPTLSASTVPGHDLPRQKLNSLEYEVYFVLSTLAYALTLAARAALQPLYSSATSSPSQEERTMAITIATKHLLSAATVESYLSTRSEGLSTSAPCMDITTPTFQALSALALAEATLLAVLKDDPYPAVVAQDRNKNDKDWMIKAPELPRVRAHLFARLCLRVSEHAARASSLLTSSRISAGSSSSSKPDSDLLKYIDDLQRVGRAKACRFLGIDADLSGQTGTGLAWLRAGLHELGILSSSSQKDTAAKKGSGSGLGFSKLKREWNEKREERRVDASKSWGSDAGCAEEARVLESLERKWTKMNDTINTQVVPPFQSLFATMPSGRDVYTIAPYVVPALDELALKAMRAPVVGDGGGERGWLDSKGDTSDEEDGGGQAGRKTVVGAFPGTGVDYLNATAGTDGTGRSSSTSYY